MPKRKRPFKSSVRQSAAAADIYFSDGPLQGHSMQYQPIETISWLFEEKHTTVQDLYRIIHPTVIAVEHHYRRHDQAPMRAWEYVYGGSTITLVNPEFDSQLKAFV